ncbi:MAG: type II secretion system protein N [Burkholderiaceae bacterium]
MRFVRGLLWGLAVLVVAVGTFLWSAPASFGDWALARISAGRVRLADTGGTLWDGRGRVVLVDTAMPASDRYLLNGLVLPGQLRWQVRALPLLIGMVDITASLDGISAPLKLSGSFNEIRGSAGVLNLPSVDLGRLGSPWNTIRPSAAVGLQWNGFTIQRGVFDGKLVIELRDASSSMSPVRPLGSYRIDVDSRRSGTDVALTTVSGPLNLAGKGVWNNRSGLRFSATAESDARERDRLQGFLALLGRREGDKIVFKIGA